MLASADMSTSTALEVSHLHQPAFDGMAGIMQATQIPAKLDYSDIILKNAKFGSATPSGQGAVTTTPSTVVPSELGTVGGRGMETPAATSQVVNPNAHSPAMVSENGDTQTINVPCMKSALQEFMLPERLTQVRLTFELWPLTFDLVFIAHSRYLNRATRRLSD